MSYTRTINQSIERQEHLTFRASALPSLEQKIHLLVSAMARAPFFDEDLKTKIEQWKERVLQESQEQAAFSLCFLLFKVVRRELEAQEGNEVNEGLLLDYEERIRELLSSLLPQTINVDRFIDDYELLLNEEQTIQKKLEIILSLFKATIKKLYDDVNSVNDELRHSFEIVRNQLSELNRNREAMGEALQQRLEMLTASVERAHQEMQSTALDIADTGYRIESHQKVYSQLMEECNRVLSGV